jgi:hypothetical protein
VVVVVVVGGKLETHNHVLQAASVCVVRAGSQLFIRPPLDKRLVHRHCSASGSAVGPPLGLGTGEFYSEGAKNNRGEGLAGRPWRDLAWRVRYAAREQEVQYIHTVQHSISVERESISTGIPR